MLIPCGPRMAVSPIYALARDRRTGKLKWAFPKADGRDRRLRIDSRDSFAIVNNRPKAVLSQFARNRTFDGEINPR